MKGLAIGRIVHYVAYGTPKGEFPALEHRAAIITGIISLTGVVSLCVFNPQGIFFNEVSYNKDANAGGTWHWPEFVD